MEYRHVVAEFFGQVWALHRAKFDEIKAVLQARASGVRLSDEEIRARVGSPRHAADHGIFDPEADAIFWAHPDGDFRAADGRQAAAPARGQVVAVVGIYGTIIPRASLMAESSGLASTERIAARVRAAVNDPAVSGIVLDIDSPGGAVLGAQELAAEIRAARKIKPVEAVANYQALSLAYWYASQASRLTASPSAQLGSIGVFAEHADISKALEAEGVNVTLISYGKNKTLGNPYEPLSDDARAELEKHVEEFGRAFESDVAKGRGVPVADVRAKFGQGLMFGAEEAVAVGLADEVGTLEDTLRRMSSRRREPAAAAAEGVGSEVRAAVEPAVQAGPTDAERAEMEAAAIRARTA